MRELFLTAVLFLAWSSALGQAPTLQEPNMWEHKHQTSSGGTVPQGMIDGSLNPELIPDITAYRLFFVAIAPIPTPSTEATAFRMASLKQLGLSLAEAMTFQNTLVTFRAKYDELIKNYNDAANAAFLRGDAPNESELLKFLGARETLVQQTKEQLGRVLSTQHMSDLDAIVQHEKGRMKIAKPALQQGQSTSGGQ